MLCILESDDKRTLALVEVDRIKKGEVVKLIKIIKGHYPKSWFLNDTKLYRKLTDEEKLELL
jgi:hypothetical protein